MEDRNAAGRKTEKPASHPNRYAHHLETLLGRMAKSAGKALDVADDDRLQDNDIGGVRSREIHNAIKLSTFGMELITALNKLEGEGEK
jgi:hypothetical protein